MASQQASSNQPWYSYKVTQGFKWTPKNPAGHSGVDIGCPLGTPVTAPVAGQITGAQCHAWGIQVDIRFTNAAGETMTVSFLHLMALAPGVKAGEVVQVGALLGYTGGVSSGVPCPTQRKYSSGAHLHFELSAGPTPPYTTYNPRNPTDTSYPVNPLAFLASIRASNGTGSSAVGANVLTTADFQGAASDQGLSTGDAEDSDPGSGATAAALLVEIPGFFGICAALDAVEQFSGYKPPTGLTGSVQVPGYTLKWFVKNINALVIRMLLIGVGVFLIIALLVSLLNINKWMQEAGGLVIPLAVSAL